MDVNSISLSKTIFTYIPACSNGTFGSGCTSTCHCPPGDTCSSINGLCGSGTCATGYSGAGCQNGTVVDVS